MKTVHDAQGMSSKERKGGYALFAHQKVGITSAYFILATWQSSYHATSRQRDIEATAAYEIKELPVRERREIGITNSAMSRTLLSVVQVGMFQQNLFTMSQISKRL